VAVIEQPPSRKEFDLPNGVLHSAVEPGRWVVESLSGPLPTDKGSVIIGCIKDEKLMPIGRKDVKARSVGKAISA
jgi:hypothetical protein